MRNRASQPDTAADEQVKTCTGVFPCRSFVMVAGAGSGKTTSLVKALAYIASRHGEKLQLGRQKVACITFTEIAAEEIWRDVGSNPLVHVSTIHSFLWTVVRSFPNDIRSWVARRIYERIAELQAEATDAGGGEQ